MSREASLIFFGIRFDIGEDEITSVENRSHPIVSRARSVACRSIVKETMFFRVLSQTRRRSH